MNANEIPEILNLEQACTALNCHRNTLRGWTNKGLIECIRLGTRGDRRFKKTDIMSFINQTE